MTKVEYLKDNKVYWFDRELTDQEKELFYLGELQGTFLRDFVEPMKETSYQQAYEALMADIETGKKLIVAFMIDNRLNEFVNDENAFSLMATFGTAKAFAEVGDLRRIRQILSSIPFDEVYTQERHEKYLKILDGE